jgi:hypothetical protein
MRAGLGEFQQLSQEGGWIRLAKRAHVLAIVIADKGRHIPIANRAAMRLTVRHDWRSCSDRLTLLACVAMNIALRLAYCAGFAGDLIFTTGAQDRQVNLDHEDSVSDGNFIAMLQVVFSRWGDIGFARSLANHVLIDQGAIQAAEVANAHIRRINVEQAMMSRNPLVGFRKAQLAFGRTADETRGAFTKHPFALGELTVHDFERYLGGHDFLSTK